LQPDSPTPRGAGCRTYGYAVRLIFRDAAGHVSLTISRSPRGRPTPRVRRRVRRVRDRSHARMPFAGHATTERGPPRGEIPGRFRGALLRRSPPRPSAHAGALEVPTTGGQTIRNAWLLLPLDLDASFPGTSRSVRPDLPAGPPLLGLSKDAPPSFEVGESAARSVCRHPDHRRSTAVALAFRPRGFSPPRRLPPPRPRRFVSPCCRSWGSPCFRSSRNELPHDAFLPFEAFPPPTATRRNESVHVATCQGQTSDFWRRAPRPH